MEYNVLVRPVHTEKKTDGGLYLPEDVQTKNEHAQTRGVLVDVSPMAFCNSDWPSDMESAKPKIGDIVSYARYAGANSRMVGRDEKDYILIKDIDITAVIEDSP